MLPIASLTKQSFIDWEGKTAAVIFTKGCNFRCPYCHNMSLVLPHLVEKTPTLGHDYILSFLQNRLNWLDGVVITGGEPTIHKGLQLFIEKIKQIGLPVKLDTNGSNPQVLQNLLHKNLINYVAMDIKTLLEPQKYNAITQTTNPALVNNVLQSLKILRDSKIKYQLRTTIVPGWHTTTDTETLKNMFINENFVLQNYREWEP